MNNKQKSRRQPNKFIGSFDWIKYLERRQSLFVLALFVRPETILLKRITGAPAQHQLSLHKNGTIFWLRPQSEIDKATKYFSGLLKKKDMRLAKWAELGMHYDKKTDELIKKYSAKNFIVNTQEYKSVIKDCENIFIYCTIIPHWVLGSLDESRPGLHGKTQPKYLKQFEFLRAHRKYPQIAEKVLARFWTAAMIQQGGKKYKLFHHATPLELDKLFYSNKKIALKTLEKRARWTLFKLTSHKGDFEFSYEKSLESKIPGLAKASVKINEVKGMVAYAGLVRGIVRIVYEDSRLSDFKKNEIIVSPSTSPSLMPVLIKCSAIVTDEGGLGSHAAIISRELGKPCIIGTKTATQVFHTGDVVIVDTSKGTVRKV